MYELRLFGFGINRSGPSDTDFYSEVPLTIVRQDRHAIVYWIEVQAPMLFAPGIAIPYEIWSCVGTVPVRNIERGTIYSAHRTAAKF